MQLLYRAASKILQLWVLAEDPSIHAWIQAWKAVDSYHRLLVAQVEVIFCFFLFFFLLNLVYFHFAMLRKLRIYSRFFFTNKVSNNGYTGLQDILWKRNGRTMCMGSTLKKKYYVVLYEH